MMDKGAVFYTKYQDIYVIKLTGEARYQLGCSFDDFLKQLFSVGDFNDILIDLTETVTIDSTFLGLLAKIANYIRNRFQRQVTIFSTNEDINQILAGVGFYSVFNICNASPSAGCAGEKMMVNDVDQSRLAGTLYDAHLILSELNCKNREMFKNVVELLHDKAAGEETGTRGKLCVTPAATDNGG